MIKLNGEVIKPTIFPDKTSQIWKIPQNLLTENRYKIEWQFESESEFMHIAQLRDLLKRDVSLYMPYLPYGRQDKEISNETTFARNTFLNLIDLLDFDNVSCFDAHSASWVKSIEPKKEVMFAAVQTSADVLIYPDNGAKEKYLPMFSDFMDSIHAEKHRDKSTGEIKQIEIVGECNGKKVLIVDDICDGGMTFILLADALIANGAEDVNLYVSHGLFTKGTKILKEAGINRIFTKTGEIYDTSN